ncbi:MAG: hypothetical protein IJG63_06100 [Oscillospiraceae bacterium]|nr:hypothetical protein [Oscillospiraceae bacterium]
MANYKIGDTRDLGACSACGNVIVIEAENGLFRPQRCGNPVKLADGNWLCGSCLRKLRIKYPQEYRLDTKQKKMLPYERAGELTAEEAERELGQIHDYLEDLREKYGFHQAVFSVEKADVKKGGLLKPSLYTVTGHVIYGTFTPLDEVSIGLNGGQKALISCLYYPHSITPVSDIQIQQVTGKLVIDYAWAEGGEEAAFIFREKSLNLKPGDIIVKD